jgi:trigger factor
MENVSIELGSPVNPPGFDDEVTGLEVGARKAFRVTFPADYPVADLAGAEVEYAVDVKGLRRKVLPDLDDEFAKDLGDLGSLEQLRERVREDLQREAERSQEREIRDDLLRQLAARVAFDVPETLVGREVDRRTEEFVRRLMDQGVDPLKAGIDWDAFRSGQREAAAHAVRAVLVLDDVARREGLQPGDEDVDREVARLAGASGRSPAAVRKRLEEDGGLSRVAAALRRDKTVEFLLSRATILSI